MPENLILPKSNNHQADQVDKENTIMMDDGLAKKYKKHTHRQHILELPDTYIGSIEKVTEPLWYHQDSLSKGEAINQLGDGSQMVCEDLTFVPGLYKIFDEILVNARDHVVRLQVKKIANRDTKTLY